MPITPLQMINETLAGKVAADRMPHLQTVVIPSILMDFYKMLDKSAPGKPVSEEYHLDDGSLSLIIKGVKEAGVPQITAVEAVGMK